MSVIDICWPQRVFLNRSPPTMFALTQAPKRTRFTELLSQLRTEDLYLIPDYLQS